MEKRKPKNVLFTHENEWAFVGIILAIISLFYYSFNFMIGGIITGCIVMYKGQTGKGLAIIILNLVLGLIGIYFHS